MFSIRLLYIKNGEKTIIILMKTRNSEKNSQTSKKPASKKRKILLGILLSSVILPILAVCLFLVGFSIYSSRQRVDSSLLPTATAAPTFYDINGNKLSYIEDGFLTQDEICDNLRFAFVATEDKRFYSHKGYDIVRIGGAILKDIKAGKAVEGASTITQQLVKNTHLTHDRTVSRKLKEIALASQLEKEYSKEEILSMYLSVIYFGNGIYGAKQAAKYYFGKDVKDLTVAESATLAAIVKNPSKYSPNKNKDAALERRNLIIDLMREQNYIPESVAKSAKSSPVVCQGLDANSAQKGLSDKDCKLYFDNVIQEVCASLDITKYQLFNGGYKIYTNFDGESQKIAVKQINNSALHEENTDRAIIIADNSSGSVLAYASTLGYNAKRQVGSTIKPILYSAAIDRQIINLMTPINDEPVDFGEYSPSNFGDKYYGLTTVKEAIKKSMNSVAVKTCDYLGIDEYFDYVKRFGISVGDDDKNYALALGATTDGINMIELASAYSTLACNGQKKPLTFVRFVTQNDEKVFSNENKTIEQVVKSSTAQQIGVALKETVKSGTAKSLSTLPFEVAAKTGTVERGDGQNSDAWCASFNNRYSVLVWHGSDSGMREKGGGYPTKQAKEVWQNIYENSMRGVEDTQDLSSRFLPIDASDLYLCEVDLYSTLKRQKPILATKNVPLEYRYKEYFALDDLPLAEGSYFDEIGEQNLTAEYSRKGVNISFVKESAYSYDVVRTDLFGSRVIKHFDSETLDLKGDFNNTYKSQTEVSFTDRPISFGLPVTYTLVAYIDDNLDIKNTSTKVVFVDVNFR